MQSNETWKWQRTLARLLSLTWLFTAWRRCKWRVGVRSLDDHVRWSLKLARDLDRDSNGGKLDFVLVRSPAHSFSEIMQDLSLRVTVRFRSLQKDPCPSSGAGLAAEAGSALHVKALQQGLFTHADHVDCESLRCYCVLPAGRTSGSSLGAERARGIINRRVLGAQPLGARCGREGSSAGSQKCSGFGTSPVHAFRLPPLVSFVL